MVSKEQADGIFKAISGFVTRKIDPVLEQVRGLRERADKSYQRYEALEARIAALERKQAQKSGVVYLNKAGGR